MSAEIQKPNGSAQSIMVRMAERFGMDHKKFEQTLMATVIPNGKASPEQVAALLIVAEKHGLNVWTRELYAFPGKNGGIVPIVPIDGWAKLANDHPQFDGMEFEEHLDDKGDVAAITCKIHRKDRKFPLAVTERMSECKRNTDPWKTHPVRMLRHKAFMQAARVAFSFSGIYDPDEAERIVEAEAKTITVRAAAQDVGALTARLEAEAAPVEVEATPMDPEPQESGPAVDDGSPEAAFADWKA